MLAAVVVIGGIILFSVANRKEVPIPEPETTAVPMVTDEWTVEEYTGGKKKTSFDGGQGGATRVQAIVKYMLGEAGKMVQIRTYFDDAFRNAGNKNVHWLKQTIPDEYQNLLMARAFCVNRDIEFKVLWRELSESGEHSWLGANAWVERIPGDVINRLDSYWRVDPNDIQQYTMAEINRALGDFKEVAIRTMQDQAKNFQEWQAQTMEKMDQQQNRQALDVMEDDDGHWLLENPLDDGTIKFQQVQHLQWRDLNGVARARQFIDEIHLPQHMMQAYDNGTTEADPDQADPERELRKRTEPRILATNRGRRPTPKASARLRRMRLTTCSKSGITSCEWTRPKTSLTCTTTIRGAETTPGFLRTTSRTVQTKRGTGR